MQQHKDGAGTRPVQQGAKGELPRLTAIRKDMRAQLLDELDMGEFADSRTLRRLRAAIAGLDTRIAKAAQV